MHRRATIYREYDYDKRGLITDDSLDLLVDDAILDSIIEWEMRESEVGV